jgi:ring-1,2-phenylacetyl-CoA epoxidase subunit PaaC
MNSDPHTPPLFEFCLALGDDALVLGHRLSEWCGHAPVLEEDIALANMGLDLIGQARLFLSYAGEVESKGRTEDRLAYFRSEGEFRNVLLAELPNGDFAVTILRQLFYAAFMHPYFKALTRSADKRLADVAAKAVKEMAYHERHASEWTIRLGDGTPESHRRLLAARDDLWTYTGELFEMGAGETALVKSGVAVDRTGIRPVWEATIKAVFAQAALALPKQGAYMQSGGRQGRHTEHLGHLLAPMQIVARTHADAAW